MSTYLRCRKLSTVGMNWVTKYVMLEHGRLPGHRGDALATASEWSDGPNKVFSIPSNLEFHGLKPSLWLRKNTIEC